MLLIRSPAVALAMQLSLFALEQDTFSLRGRPEMSMRRSESYGERETG